MQFWKSLKLIIFIILQWYVTDNESAKILAIFPSPGGSQYILVQPYLKALVAKGHQVTAISAFPQKTPLENFRDIEVLEVLKYGGDIWSYATAKISKLQEISDFSMYYITLAKDVLNNKNVQKLLSSKGEYFDLVIIETLQTDALFGIADHFQAPMIGVSSYGADPYIDALTDNISPLAYTPLYSGSSTERMNFAQRLENMWHNLLMLGHRVLVQYPMHDQLFKEYFPHASKSLQELRQNISLVLLNQHFSLSYPRPYVTNMIEVAGFHLQHKPQPLPLEIEEFISSSPQSVIYFSMGSNIKSENFPAPIRKIILETFAQLPYKILWKFENPALMPDKPPNVFISKWFPQGDILAHPRVKLFISHGGLLSIIESIYHGKPVLGMPIFFDQHLNINRAKQYGFCLSVAFWELNTAIFLEAITEVMEKPQYGEKAKEMSERFRDQPIDPLEKALYWTEYVLRHRGAGFLKSPAQHLNYWQRRSWDCVALFAAGFSLTLIVMIFVLVKIKKICVHLLHLKTNKEKQN